MSEIAQTTDNNCVARAISTMRLALGYERGLPDAFPLGGKKVPELICLLGDCFPRHLVKVFCSRGDYEAALFPVPTIVYGGEDWTPTPQDDQCLIAFAYGPSDKDDKRCHMVIGAPTLYDSTRLTFVLCVNLAQ